jgi:catechol 2,3-dioxygenase-like lactoylglutathione lyase family enzyme
MPNGFHHLSLVCSNARRTLRFYTQVLGLRLVKTTVDFDNPEHYHLYFGDAHGTPGTLISAYEWHIAPKGAAGVGGVASVALGVNDLAGWQVRLAGQAVAYEGASEREGAPALRLRDPDGMQIELVEDGLAGVTPHTHQLSCLSANLSLLGEFYGGVLGMQAPLCQRGRMLGLGGVAAGLCRSAGCNDSLSRHCKSGCRITSWPWMWRRWARCARSCFPEAGWPPKFWTGSIIRVS